MKLLIAIFFLLTTSGFVEALDRNSINAPEELNGLYQVISESKDYKFTDLVLCYKCESIPQKPNDPGAPTKPGFYHENIRYRFANVHFAKGMIQFETESVNHVKFRFKGDLEMKADPSFDPDVLLRSLNGTLETIVNDKTKQTDKITFGEAVVY